MKKKLAILLCLVMVFGSLYGCGAKNDVQEESNKIKVVTTIFPVYEWVRNVIGDEAENVDLTMLLGNGVDLHSYQPTAGDIKSIKECDVLVYVGGESDDWIEDAVKEASNKDMKVINLMEMLGSSKKVEEMVEGMEESHHHHHDHDEDHDKEEANHHDHDKNHDKEEAHGHDHDEDHDKEEAHHHNHDEDHDKEEAHGHDHDEEHDGEHHHHDGEIEYDEHMWLSLKNAKLAVSEILKVMREIDKDNMSVYEENANGYISELDNLDIEYLEAVKHSKKKTLVFGDRFPFRYLVDDYNLEYYAAFIGCSAETEASLNTILFLANKVDEKKLKAVMTIEGKNHNIAETVVENAKTKDLKILTLDSMQATTKEDVANGATYLQIMKENLEVLKEALK